MPTLNSSISQLREGLTNIIAKGYAETSKWGAHLLNVIQPVVRPLAVQMQKNHYLAIAVFTLANGIFLLVLHLLTQRKSGNELENGHLFRRRVKMIFVELMLVGGSFAAYNVLLSKATEYRLSYVALTGIAASAVALRLIFKKPELSARSHPNNNSTTIPSQPTPSYSQDIGLSSSHPDDSQDIELSSSNPTLPSSISFNSLEGGNSTANDVESSPPQKFTREWLLEELEFLNDDEAIEFFIECHNEAEQKTIYKLINTIQKEQFAAAASQAPPSPSAPSYSNSDTPPPPPPPPGPPPPPPPPPPGPPPAVQLFKPLIISKSTSLVSATNTNDASNIAAEAATSRGKLRPASERTPQTPPRPEATDIAAQAANFRFKPASERKTPTQRPISDVTPEALRITLRPANERKIPTQLPVSSDNKMQALQNALARTLNARRGVLSEDHGTTSDEDEWEKGDLNTSKLSDEKLREQGVLIVNIGHGAMRN